MSTNEITSNLDIITDREMYAERMKKAGLFLLFIVFGLIVFVFGTSYFDQFATNSSGSFKILSSGLFFGLALFSGRFDSLERFKGIFYAFFVASFVNVVTWYFAFYARDELFELLSISLTTIQGMTTAKISEAVLTIGTILLLVKVSGDDLGSVYIQRGNLKWALRIGILALLNLIAMGFMIASFSGQEMDSVVANIPWLVLFAVANGFMEELWFRGLFLGRLQAHIGEGGALWMTSIWFGIMHIFAVYVSGAAALVFGVVAITLGLAFGVLMQKTKTIWGATIFHSAADLHWFIAFGL